MMPNAGEDSVCAFSGVVADQFAPPVRVEKAVIDRFSIGPEQALRETGKLMAPCGSGEEELCTRSRRPG
jgi:hypothetical protein